MRKRRQYYQSPPVIGTSCRPLWSNDPITVAVDGAHYALHTFPGVRIPRLMGANRRGSRARNKKKPPPFGGGFDSPDSRTVSTPPVPLSRGPSRCGLPARSSRCLGHKR